MLQFFKICSKEKIVGYILTENKLIKEYDLIVRKYKPDEMLKHKDELNNKSDKKEIEYLKTIGVIK